MHSDGVPGGEGETFLCSLGGGDEIAPNWRRKEKRVGTQALDVGPRKRANALFKKRPGPTRGQEESQEVWG